MQMNYGKVLGRAWQILWSYRVLWVFGVIVAFCSAAGGQNPQTTFDGDNGLGEIAMPVLPPEVVTTLIGIALAVCCLAIVLTILRFIGLYVGQTALIRMVDDYEETGEKRGVRQGFRLGWSRTTLRLFVIDLITRLPGIFVVFLLVLLGLVLFGVVVLTRGAVVVTVLALVAGIGLAFLLGLVLMAIGLVASVLRQFFWRVCALEELGVIESLIQGWAFVKQHLGDVVLMSLIMVGLEIGWIMVMIPFVLVLLVVAAVVGVLPALMVFGLANLAFEGAVLPVILAAVIGLAIFIPVFAAPLIFLGGLAEVFKSSVWTLTYRELRALGGLQPEPEALPEPDTAGLA
jgi:hypothetical protein